MSTQEHNSPSSIIGKTPAEPKPAAAKPAAARPASPRGGKPAPAQPAPKRRGDQSPDQAPADAKMTAKEKKAAKKKEAAEQKAAAAAAAGEEHHHSTFMRDSGACLFSMVVHAALLLVLAFIVVRMPDKEVPQEVTSVPFEERPEEELQEIVLEDTLKPVEEITETTVSSSPTAVGVPGGAATAVSAPAMQQTTTQNTEGPNVKADFAAVMSLPGTKMVEAVPDGVLGDPRAIVDNYQQAMDRITQEIMWMLDKGNVLVIWAFDQSESMEDDRAEIRARVDKVYQELGLADSASGDALLTSITSYGAGFNVLTEKPTSDIGEIRRAIGRVQNDPSGKEMMCQAVAAAINRHKTYARGRQMALILVTDESGDQQDNRQFLETAIGMAKAAKCRIYTLGRESMFGYPYAYMRWQHPQTKRWHWLQVDRGPETGFVEQLQTNGFWRRYDAFDAGFGPYEQTRMSRETNGIFFMLPSVEKTIVQSKKRRYMLEAMKAYKPDLRKRLDVLADRDKYPLRAGLWKVVSDLNPYNPEAAKIIVMRQAFSLDRNEFLQQANRQQQKAIIYLKYLARVQQEMETSEVRKLREQEVEPRWQANYDLIYAQVIAYQARIYEYGAYLEEFKKKPKIVPPTRPPNLKLVHWDISTRRELVAEEKSMPYIEKATALFKEVIRLHPGTPWAARAEWELKRGFGVHLVPDYDPPYVKVSNPIPIPKL